MAETGARAAPGAPRKVVAMHPEEFYGEGPGDAPEGAEGAEEAAKAARLTEALRAGDDAAGFAALVAALRPARASLLEASRCALCEDRPRVLEWLLAARDAPAHPLYDIESARLAAERGARAALEALARHPAVVVRNALRLARRAIDEL